LVWSLNEHIERLFRIDKIMDFEIEDDDPYNFESNWSKPSKAGYFGGSGFGDKGGGGDDIYDYDFGGGIGKTETTHYSSSPESYSKPQKVEKKEAKVTKDKVTHDNAMEKAKSMLSKYSAKPTVKKPVVKKFTDDFDEDDISLGSDDMSDDGRKGGYPESPGDFNVKSKFKPTLTKQTSKKNFDLEEVIFVILLFFSIDSVSIDNRTNKKVNWRQLLRFMMPIKHALSSPKERIRPGK
jgi:hypothetical protein